MFYPIYLFTVLIFGLIMSTMNSQLEQLGAAQQFQGALAAQYAAENTIENSWLQIKERVDQDNSAFSYLESFDLEAAVSDGVSADMKASHYAINLVDKQITDEYFPPELQNKGHFDEFRFIDVAPESNFSTLYFDYTLTAQSTAGIIIDIFIFPREEQVSFGTLQYLNTNRDVTRNIERVVFHSVENKVGIASGGLTFSVRDDAGKYEDRIVIAGLIPLSKNYIVRVSTIKKDEMEYALTAYGSDGGVSLPLTRQYAHIDAEAETQNMYQRIEQTQRTFSPLQPGLNFALFSDQTISK